jgi:hypothetical protein
MEEIDEEFESLSNAHCVSVHTTLGGLHLHGMYDSEKPFLLCAPATANDDEDPLAPEEFLQERRKDGAVIMIYDNDAMRDNPDTYLRFQEREHHMYNMMLDGIMRDASDNAERTERDHLHLERTLLARAEAADCLPSTMRMLRFFKRAHEGKDLEESLSLHIGDHQGQISALEELRRIAIAGKRFFDYHRLSARSMHGIIDSIINKYDCLIEYEKRECSYLQQQQELCCPL